MRSTVGQVPVLALAVSLRARPPLMLAGGTAAFAQAPDQAVVGTHQTPPAAGTSRWRRSACRHPD